MLRRFAHLNRQAKMTIVVTDRRSFKERPNVSTMNDVAKVCQNCSMWSDVSDGLI